MSCSRKPYSSAGSSASSGSIARVELERVALHPLRVLARAGVLRPERARERRHRLLVRALEQPALRALDLDEMAKVAGVEDELLLVGAAVDAAHRRPHAGAREALDDAEQLEWPERLQQQRVRAGCAGHVLHVVHSGQQDDADLARVLARLQLAAEREPVHAGHADVEHDHVRTRRRDPRLGLGGASGLVHLDLDVLEGRPQELAEPGIVVNQQQAHSFPPGSKSLVDKGIGHWDRTLSRTYPVRGSRRSRRSERGRATAGRALDPVRAEEAPQPPRRELRAEDRRRRGAALAVAKTRRVELRRSPPPLLGQLVDLLLLDEEPGSGEEPRPAADVVLVEPAVVARLAARHA